jgi:pimeloyl-ACP methyl ester carboxylesterase
MLLTLLAGSAFVLSVLTASVLLHRRLRQRKIAARLRIHGSNGLVEEGFHKIGGIEQWIGIRGESVENPVLLIVHGGPGSSCSIFTPLIRSWESYFTVIQWDQRGSGKTLGRTGQDGTGELTMDRLIRDGIEVAEFVRARLHKDKVILLACSLGSTFGLSMIRRRPDLFSAYVGTDQNVGMVRDREVIHRSAIDRLRMIGSKKGVAELERIGSDPSRWTAEDYMTSARWTMKSDPEFFQRIMTLLKNAIWFSPSQGLLDIRHFITGMHFSLAQLINDIRSYDAWQEGTRFEVPFFVFQGAEDVLTVPSLARAYFDDVTAPVKGLTLIRNAGHFAAFTQPEQFLHELLTQVLPLVS